MKKDEFDNLLLSIKNCTIRSNKLKITIYDGNRQLVNDDDYVLTDEGGLLLVEALKSNPYITELNLSHTDITNKTVIALSSIPTLQKLNLYETNVRSEGVIALTHTNLKSLVLGESALMYDDIDQKTKVIDALITNHTIEELELTYTINDDNLIDKLIRENDTITSLSIASNLLTNNALRSLPLNNTLKSINISQNCSITNIGIDYLVSSPSLETVYMSENENVTTSGLYKFIGSNFKKVDFFNNRIKYAARKQFQKDFEQSLLKKQSDDATLTTDDDLHTHLSGDIDQQCIQELSD